ncbi:MAG TPA: inorganic phosphate transporter [Pseudomonadota bacterium]|nr:inorganic phosphate transporter [Pseudomonadota bacterium]
MPVSTTHVATGGLFGIGLITGTARLRTIASILLAWATTLPLGALLGAAAMLLQKRLG